MSKFKKRTSEVEAVQWHPGDRNDAVCLRDHVSTVGPHTHFEDEVYHLEPGDWGA